MSVVVVVIVVFSVVVVVVGVADIEVVIGLEVSYRRERGPGGSSGGVMQDGHLSFHKEIEIRGVLSINIMVNLN